MLFKPEVGPKKRLHGVKIKAIRKWELNTRDSFINFRTEDIFVGRCHSNKYKKLKNYQKYIQEVIYNERVIICRVFRR